MGRRCLGSLLIRSAFHFHVFHLHRLSYQQRINEPDFETNHQVKKKEKQQKKQFQIKINDQNNLLVYSCNSKTTQQAFSESRSLAWLLSTYQFQK